MAAVLRPYLFTGACRCDRTRGKTEAALNLRKKKSPLKRKRAGRPKRAAAASKALTALAGIDPDSVDLRRILAAIASDLAAPASARVAACRVLKDMPPKDRDGEEHPARANGAPADDLSQRAIDMLNRRRLH